MFEVKVIQVGDKLGIALPDQVANQLDAQDGGSIFLENMCDGSYRLAKHDEKFVQQMELVDGQMHEEDA